MRPTRGSSSISSATASATVNRTGLTWNRSTIGSGRGVSARMAALWRRRTLVPSSRSGIRPANRSSGPTRRGNEQVGLVGEAAEDLGDVLERLALDQARQQQVALLPQCELLVEVAVVGARAAGGGS